MLYGFYGRRIEIQKVKVKSFLKEKFYAHEYDIPLDRVGHCREPHVLSFLFEPLSRSYDPKCEGHPFKVKGLTDINYVLTCCSFP